MLGVILPIFSKKLTEHYEMLKNNVDINIANYIIENMGECINHRLLEKKFLNMFLISVKVIYPINIFLRFFMINKK